MTQHGRPNRARSTWARLAVVVSAVTLATLGPVASASAHVTITPSTTAAGAQATLVLSVGHGCAGSPTTEMTVQIPEGINSVSPTRSALWVAEKEMETLDPPVTDGHGNEIVERVASITYTTDEPLPEGYRDTLEMVVTLPDTEGETVAFPTIQTCVEGESAWIEVAEDGESADDLEEPAPAFTLTAASDTHGAGATPQADEESGGSGSMAVAGLGAGILGMALGAAALVLQRRRA